MKLRLHLLAQAALALCVTSAQAGSWTITDLGPHAGFSEGQPMSINDNGWVVFGNMVMSPGAGGVYQAQTVANILQFRGINNANVAVGMDMSNNAGMVWSGGAAASALPMPAGSVGSQAFAINDAGQIAGQIGGGPLWGGVRWDPNGAGGYDPSQLGFLMNGSSTSYATGPGVGINNGGTAVINQIWPYYNAARSGPAGTTVISGTDGRDPLGPQPDLRPANFCWDTQCVFIGKAINDAGTVVGGGNPSTGSTAEYRPFIWTMGGVTMLPVTTPGGGINGFANGVNDNGVVVGGVWYASFDHRATMWTQSGSGWTQTYLNELLPADSPWGTLTEAVDVNEHGQIIGWGNYMGAPHIFLLTPAIPEPGTWAMLLTGLGLLGFVARRRFREGAAG